MAQSPGLINLRGPIQGVVFWGVRNLPIKDELEINVFLYSEVIQHSSELTPNRTSGRKCDNGQVLEDSRVGEVRLVWKHHPCRCWDASKLFE